MAVAGPSPDDGQCWLTGLRAGIVWTGSANDSASALPAHIVVPPATSTVTAVAANQKVCNSSRAGAADVHHCGEVPVLSGTPHTCPPGPSCGPLWLSTISHRIDAPSSFSHEASASRTLDVHPPSRHLEELPTARAFAVAMLQRQSSYWSLRKYFTSFTSVHLPEVAKEMDICWLLAYL